MGAHTDYYWPIDGPNRNGRMAWPPYVGGHRAPGEANDTPWPPPRSAMSWDPPGADAVITGWTTEPFEVHIGATEAAIGLARALDAQVRDVWSGNADTDKFWAKEDLPNFYD